MLGQDLTPPLVKDLFKACSEGKVEVIRNLLKQEIDINYLGKSNRTALHIASYGKKIDCVSALLENGANVDQVDTLGCTSLHLCCSPVESIHTFEICELLLSFGADVNAVTNNNETPGHYAVKSGYFKSLSLMIDMNCDVNIVNDKGENLFDFAKMYRQKEIAKYLATMNSNDDISTGMSRKRLPSDNFTSDNFTSEFESDNDESSDVIKCRPKNLSLNLIQTEESDEDSTSSTTPFSPDLVSEMTDDHDCVSESRNVKQSYELFKTLVDEQFEGDLNEDDELLLAELVQMGFESNTLAQSTPFQEAIVMNFMTPSTGEEPGYEEFGVANKPVAIEKNEGAEPTIVVEECRGSDLETPETPSSVTPSPRFETVLNLDESRLSKEARFRQLLSENESLKKVVSDYQDLLEQITKDTSNAL